MTVFRPSQRLSSRAYKLVRRIVQLMCAIAVVLLISAVYLNVYGVPKPLLRKVVRRINEMGLSIDVEKINLTLHGWKATNVRYYSKYPDDLEPVFSAPEIFLKKSNVVQDLPSKSRGFDLRASGATLYPSARWCIGFPENSGLRRIKDMEFTVIRSAEGTTIKNGTIAWGNVHFLINGTLLNGAVPEEFKERLPKEQGGVPIHFTPQLYGCIENVLNAIECTKPIVVDIDFTIDPSEPAKSRCSVSASTGLFEFRDVSFNHGEVSASYEYPAFRLTRAVLQKDNEAFEVNGEYDLDTERAQLQISNRIASKRLFLLLPQYVLNVLSLCGIQATSFPCVDLQFGPSLPKYLLQHISGSFSLNNTVFRHLEITSLSGNVSRTGSRLDFFNLQGAVLGQENRAALTGSCMAGGSATGEIFWDSGSHEFGVLAEGALDPNLLLEPLSMVSIATNVIHRFKFDEQPPHVRLELGACYDDWHSFFISVRGSAADMRFHDVPFSSVNASAYYSEGILTLDPIVAKQGIDYLKGSASLDFHKDTVTFDALGSVNPRTIEEVVYPGSGIFSHHVKVTGDIQLAARGMLDWRHMVATSFSADVHAGRVELPFAALDQFAATVSGEGPVIKFQDAAFNMYGGDGKGTLSLLLDPSKEGVPYKVDMEVKHADFKKCLEYINPDAILNTMGEMSLKLQADADLSHDFFEIANGQGSLGIRHGQLADLPLFRSFSFVVRKLIPSFSVFSINRLNGDFKLKDGVIYTKNAYFDGDILSAKGHGSYSKQRGFDAYVQAQVLSDSSISKILRFFTDPILKLFEIKLEGTLSNPEWKLDMFSVDEKPGTKGE